MKIKVSIKGVEVLTISEVSKITVCLLTLYTEFEYVHSKHVFSSIAWVMANKTLLSTRSKRCQHFLRKFLICMVFALLAAKSM